MISIQRVQLPVGTVAQRRAVVVRAEASSAPPPPPEVNPNVCAKCGIDLKDAEKGCKDGRIAGGIGAVAEWWPIKAYRPCPNLGKTGKDYSRKGQPIDEVLFGKK